MGHDSHSILVPEFEFNHDILNFLKIQNFQNLVESAWTVALSFKLKYVRLFVHFRGLPLSIAIVTNLKILTNFLDYYCRQGGK